MKGLSPRGRGNRARISGCRIIYRSIPAWAGEPRQNIRVPDHIPVYPRVGGGTNEESYWRRVNAGLSPRGRGNLTKAINPDTYVRSIPAWAGEP